MTVFDAIAEANEILHGEIVEESPSPRWQAIIAVGDFVETVPEVVWEFAKTWGRSSDSDLRDAIATCLLEHLLEFHFAKVFPKVADEVARNANFAATFQRCWKFGESSLPGNCEEFDELQALAAGRTDGI